MLANWAGQLAYELSMAQMVPAVNRLECLHKFWLSWARAWRVAPKLVQLVTRRCFRLKGQTPGLTEFGINLLLRHVDLLSVALHTIQSTPHFPHFAYLLVPHRLTQEPEDDHAGRHLAFSLGSQDLSAVYLTHGQSASKRV